MPPSQLGPMLRCQSSALSPRGAKGGRAGSRHGSSAPRRSFSCAPRWHFLRSCARVGDAFSTLFRSESLEVGSRFSSSLAPATTNLSLSCPAASGLRAVRTYSPWPPRDSSCPLLSAPRAVCYSLLISSMATNPLWLALRCVNAPRAAAGCFLW